MGCKIIFNLGNDENLTLDSNLESNEVSISEIAKLLLDNESFRKELASTIKINRSIRELTSEDIAREGIVHNMTVFDLASVDPNHDWTGIDQTIKLLNVNSFEYFGLSISECIINNGSDKIIVVNTDDPKQISKLYYFLQAKTKLQSASRNLSEYDYSITPVLNALPSIIEGLEKRLKKEKYSELRDKGDEITKKELAQLANLELINTIVQHFKEKIPTSELELMLDYVENKNIYRTLVFSGKSVNNELNKLLHVILDLYSKETTYSDIFALHVSEHGKFLPADGLFKISKSSLSEAIQLKEESIKAKLEESENLSDKEKKELEKLYNKLTQFLNIESPTSRQWNEILQELSLSIDDEWMYRFDSANKNSIFLKNEFYTILDVIEDCTYNTLKSFKFEREHKGYLIYSHNNKYYASRHPLTLQSHGKSYKTVSDCLKAIDTKVKFEPFYQNTLVEFKSGKQEIYLPRKYNEKSIVRSLDIPLNLKYLENKVERNFLYLKSSENTLETFHEYLKSLLLDYSDSKMNYITSILDTSEKAAAFLYLIRDKYPTVTKFEYSQFKDALNTIKNAKYKYYIVTHSGQPNLRYNIKFNNYLELSITENDQKDTSEIPVRRTIISPVKLSDITNNKMVSIDSKYDTPVPMISILESLKEVLENKFGVKINILSRSDLDDMFREVFKQKPEEGIRGFVHNGEIYINAYLASPSDMLHEFGHILLGILKSRNFENFLTLVEAAVKTKEGISLKAKLKSTEYKFLADPDLNEEVFVRLFSTYLNGKSYDTYFNSLLEEGKQELDLALKGLFGEDSVNLDDKYSTKFKELFGLFNKNVGAFISQNNGLLLDTSKKSAVTYNKIASIIESKIRANKEQENILKSLELERESKYKALTKAIDKYTNTEKKYSEEEAQISDPESKEKLEEKHAKKLQELNESITKLELELNTIDEKLESENKNVGIEEDC